MIIFAYNIYMFDNNNKQLFLTNANDCGKWKIEEKILINECL